METSTSVNNSSYTTVIQNTITNCIFTREDPAWLQFLHDYTDEIRLHSGILEVTEALMLRYRYRIRDFLAEHIAPDTGLEQVFHIVNRLSNDLDFNFDVKQVYIPDRTYIETIYRTFRTRQANLKRLHCDEFNHLDQ